MILDGRRVDQFEVYCFIVNYKNVGMAINFSKALWAKSSDLGGLPLICHLLDVAAVAYELIGELPDAILAHRAHQLKLLSAQAQSWLAALVGCHDMGKATPGFQSKWPEGKARVAAAGFSFPVGAPDRHDVASAHLLRQALRRKGLRDQDSSLLADAVAAHHGFVIPAHERAKQARFGLDANWSGAQAWLFDSVCAAIGVSDVPSVTDQDEARADLFHWLAGLCSTADWIGSSEELFPHDRPLADPGIWFQRSRSIARVALARCGLVSAGLPAIRIPEDALKVALPPSTEARPLQQAVLDAINPMPAGPVLVVIEAPMGEGKTEAAFAIDAWLRSRGESRGLYIAMPTQATSNALFGRLGAYLDRLSLPRPVQVQLAHGSASHEQTEWRLREIGFGGMDASVTASAWLTGGKRVMLAANAVGTVDQALVAVLNAKHHFVRHFGLADRLVVFDEVHAYDTYTGGLIERLLAWLHASGSSVVLMSATLPRQRKLALLKQYGSHEPDEVPYPRLSVVTRSKTQSVHFPARQQSTVMVKPCSAEEATVVSQALSIASQGACVLVVVNKVARAQDIYAQIAAGTSKVVLFHARFPMEQRLAIEGDVLERFGVSGQDRAGWIMVATQVAEQSLDVDFDTLFTDIAPVDLLFQRIGRTHRHERPRPPGFTEPVVHVCGLDGSQGAIPPDRLTSRVYDKLPVLRTAHWLHGRSALSLPLDIDASVQWVYGEAPPEPTSPAFASAHEQARSAYLQQQAHQADLASKAALPLPSEWHGLAQSQPQDDEAVSNGLARFGTRLGGKSLSCIPVYLLDEGYSVHGVHPDWKQGRAIPEAVARALGQRYLRISNHLLVQHLEKLPPIRGWDRHSELVGHLPLLLDSTGEIQIPGVQIRLDPKLGLVIRHLPRTGGLDA